MPHHTQNSTYNTHNTYSTYNIYNCQDNPAVTGSLPAVQKFGS
jgi:hypothetical protein